MCCPGHFRCSWWSHLTYIDPCIIWNSGPSTQKNPKSSEEALFFTRVSPRVAHVGALVVKDDVARYAEKAGLYVLTQTSEGGADLINRRNFRAKEFSWLSPIIKHLSSFQSSIFNYQYSIPMRPLLRHKICQRPALRSTASLAVDNDYVPIASLW